MNIRGRGNRDGGRLAVTAWCLVAMALPRAAHGSGVTISVTNLPAWSDLAEGQPVALVGTLNGWNNNANVATVQQHTLTYTLADVGILTPLGSDWRDLPAGANAAFQLVKPGSWTSLVKADFLSNEGNFRLALPEGAAPVVTINGGPVPTLVDQDTAVSVNGVRADTRVLVDPSRFAYPGGRWKALIMSYDDGHVQDRNLAPLLRSHGIRGTFHLNSGWFDTDTFLASAEVPALFAGHEISIHTVDHPDLTQTADGTVQWEVGHCRYILSGLAGHDVNSMSYPFGTYDRRVMNLTAGQGVTCSRTVLKATALDYFPPNFLKWHPTCHHADADWFADQLINRSERSLSLLFIWGHSYELDNTYANNSWAYMDALCRKLGDRGDIWYCGMSEMHDYLVALEGVHFTSNRVHNPSDHITVWAKLPDTLGQVRPGRHLAYPPGRLTVRPPILYEGDTVHLTYRADGNGLAGSMSLWLHIGHDGWLDTRDVLMTNDGAGAWHAAYAISNGARRLDWMFFDDNGVSDDALGSDWAAPVRGLPAAAPSALQMVPGDPVVATASGGGQNDAGDAFDLNRAGGGLAANLQGGFGNPGILYLNHDATNLYIGGTGVQMGGNNNGLVVFLSVDTLADGVANLWSIRGAPAGLDALHNVALSPAAQVAIVLGDEYGDGMFPHFNLGSGYDFGQGVFRLSTNSAFFAPVPGARLSQFDGTNDVPTTSADEDGNSATDRWKAAIPWSSLGAPLGARSIGTCHVSALLASDGVSGNDRYLSSNYLGADTQSSLDGYGNFGFNFVTLTGQSIGLPSDDSDRDGLPDGWTQIHFQHPLGRADDASRAGDDADGDGMPNGCEFGAGTDPTNRGSVFAISRSPVADGPVPRFQFDSVAGRQYGLAWTTNLMDAAAWRDGSETVTATGPLTEVALPTDGPTRCCRVVVLPP